MFVAGSHWEVPDVMFRSVPLHASSPILTHIHVVPQAVSMLPSPFPLKTVMAQTPLYRSALARRFVVGASACSGGTVGRSAREDFTRSVSPGEYGVMLLVGPSGTPLRCCHWVWPHPLWSFPIPSIPGHPATSFGLSGVYRSASPLGQGRLQIRCRISPMGLPLALLLSSLDTIHPLWLPSPPVYQTACRQHHPSGFWHAPVLS